jgi:DeoR/GlpR family transcriptional regulator of sugar metabolism
MRRASRKITFRNIAVSVITRRVQSFRHQQILALLAHKGVLRRRGLDERFGVTPMTIWRDFRKLEELGLARRTRGGIRALESTGHERVFESKDAEGRAAKDRIAVLAVRLFIREGDVIAMEGGTSVAALIAHLPPRKITVLTNSLPVALQVRSLRPHLPVRVVGGWLSPVSGNLTGGEALREIAKSAADVCFLSATGFDAKNGPTDPNPLEIEVKRAWSAVSKRTVLLLESRKFGVKSAAVTLHPRRLHAVVTDAAPPPEIRRRLESLGVAVHAG